MSETAYAVAGLLDVVLGALIAPPTKEQRIANTRKYLLEKVATGQRTMRETVCEKLELDKLTNRQIAFILDMDIEDVNKSIMRWFDYLNPIF